MLAGSNLHPAVSIAPTLVFCRMTLRRSSCIVTGAAVETFCTAAPHRSPHLVSHWLWLRSRRGLADVPAVVRASRFARRRAAQVPRRLCCARCGRGYSHRSCGTASPQDGLAAVSWTHATQRAVGPATGCLGCAGMRGRRQGRSTSSWETCHQSDSLPCFPKTYAEISRGCASYIRVTAQKDRALDTTFSQEFRWFLSCA